MRVMDRVASALLSRLERAACRHTEKQLCARLGAIGKGCTLNGRIHVSAPERMRMGNNVHIGTGAWIRAEGGLTIEDNTHISRNVVIYTVNHDYNGKWLPYDEALVGRSVIIGANVWIGMGVSIAPGARIGEGAIIGLGATVAGEVPPRAIVVSPKLRIVGYRDEDRYEIAKASGVYGGPDGRPVSFANDTKP